MWIQLWITVCESHWMVHTPTWWSWELIWQAIELANIDLPDLISVSVNKKIGQFTNLLNLRLSIGLINFSILRWFRVLQSVKTKNRQAKISKFLVILQKLRRYTHKTASEQEWIRNELMGWMHFESRSKGHPFGDACYWQSLERWSTVRKHNHLGDE